MDGMEATDESSLSGGGYSLYISAAIEQHHLHKSIFRPFSGKIPFSPFQEVSIFVVLKFNIAKVCNSFRIFGFVIRNRHF